MKRRDLFKTLGCLVTIGAVGVSAKPVRKYGRLTVGGHHHHLQSTGENLRVYVDGVEVTKCYEADDVDGYALAFCQDPKEHRAHVKAGHLHIGGDGHVCKVRLTGRVVIAPGPEGFLA